MEFIKQTYLVRLFKQNKFLFVLVIGFIFFQQFLYLKDNSSFPWFVWAMYSHTEYVSEEKQQQEIFVNNERIDVTAFPIWKEETLLHTVKKYYQLQQNNWKDPLTEKVIKRTQRLPTFVQKYFIEHLTNNESNTALFPAWIKQYLETKLLYYPVKSIELHEATYTIQKNQFIPKDTSKVLLKLAY